ncbi:MAG: DUF11 domain-containing protein, partial [Deltaproteobacteria bacterium]|nr:DUF11 domain-containing protein [Deltaproteobacteria bacterium]
PVGIETIINTVTVADDGTNGPDPTPDNNAASDTNTVLAAPDLTVSKDDSQTNALPDETLTYTITINNVGTQDATGVVINDTLAAQGIMLISASDSGSELDGVVTWPTFGLAVGTSVTRTVTIRIDDPLPAGIETITNTATVTDDGTNGPDPTPEDNTASDINSVEAVPDLRITKDDGNVSSVPGNIITYTLTYANVGNQDATGVVITDTVPANTTFSAVSSSSVWSCSDGSPAGTVCTFDMGDLAGGVSGRVI